ncbi:MAG TPA: sigma-70 family RNA polymerase sigma factor [Candidatus Avipropionibacterium avicola]|uniref:Sigma-70 family RNA polymerase sigma factor n=1 Tax=Candidatus Avipropionibacterium avicola TaxID=2840701 RepID=A0A9D1KML5_9ACTN|nr:sigma-70 family RNA polymerase sigma factor [Candidatus Avipropionibacterium avicola]
MVRVTITAPVSDDLEEHRREILAHCYRFFGNHAEAEDATQETMVRAWQRASDFEGRSSVRTWLYRIATRICLDMAKSPQRRALPVDLQTAGQVPEDPTTLRTMPESTWIGPIADHQLPERSDPAELAQLHDSVRLAFISALQLLPPRQRAVLILRDVLAWSAAECGAALELTVASVNSALARARRTMAGARGVREESEVDGSGNRSLLDEADRELMERYVSAFERYDVAGLVALLTEDAQFSMPPFALWFEGRDSIEEWWNGPGAICRDSRLLLTRANGRPAVAAYHSVGDGRWEPFAIHVVDRAGDSISSITHFMGAGVFEEFGLPDVITEASDQGH